MNQREYLEPVFIDAHNIPDAWYKLNKKLWEMDNIYEYPVEWGSAPGMLRREFDFMFCRIKHPGQRPLCDPLEGKTLQPPTTMDKIEKYFNTYILNPGKEEGERYSYGERICEQVDHVVNFYKTKGFNHVKCCIEVGKPEDQATGKSLPCLRLIDLKIRKDRLANVYRLHFIVYFRVWNGYIAFQENLGGLQLFKEWLIEQIGNSPTDGLPLEDGEIICMSKSWNVREEMFGMSKQLVGKE